MCAQIPGRSSWPSAAHMGGACATWAKWGGPRILRPCGEDPTAVLGGISGRMGKDPRAAWGGPSGHVGGTPGPLGHMGTTPGLCGEEPQAMWGGL